MGMDLALALDLDLIAVKENGATIGIINGTMAIGINQTGTSQTGTNLIGTNLIGIKSPFQNGKSQKTAKMANGITNGTINGTMHQTINGITNGKMAQIGMKSHMM